MSPTNDADDDKERGKSGAHPARAEGDGLPAADSADEPLEGVFLPMLSGVVAPPPSLRDRILASVTPQTFAFVMRNEGPWLPRPGAPVAVKALLADSRDRISTRLVRFETPELLPAPELAGRRAFYVVQGALAHADSGESLSAGAFRDEYPPEPWRATAGTLVIEYGENGGAAPVAQTHHAERATWIDALPGGRVRLIEGGDDGPRSFLVLSMSPRSTLPSHPHSGVEELYILSGSCTLDRRTLTAGDYHRAAAQSTHPDTHTLDDGCDVLVVVRDPDLFAGREGGE